MTRESTAITVGTTMTAIRELLVCVFVNTEADEEAAAATEAVLEVGSVEMATEAIMSVRHSPSFVT